MSSRVQKGDSMRITNASTTSVIEANTPVLVGVVLALTTEQIPIAGEGEAVLTEVHKVRKDDSVFAQGEVTYWDPDGTSVGGDTGCLSTTDTDPRVGFAFAPALTGDETVNIKLNG